MHRILGRGERRSSRARDIFHGGLGQLRQHCQSGQENQLGALGLMVNIVVLWQTVCTPKPLSTTSSPTGTTPT
ncbi:MAG: Tn3 family transposase [Acidimicrobiales bacterium]